MNTLNSMIAPFDLDSVKEDTTAITEDSASICEDLASVTLRYHVFECLWWIVAIPVYGLPGFLAFSVLMLLNVQLGALGCILGIPLALGLTVSGIVLVAGALTKMLPNIKEGSYVLGANAQELIHWLLRYGVANYLRLLGILPLVFSNPAARRLYFWLNGAQIDYTSRISYDAQLLDLSLLEIGEGTKIGAFTTICGHYSDANAFVLGRIRIGKNVLIGGNVLIGPNTEIGDGAIVHATSAILPGTVIGAGEVWGGNPARLRSMPNHPKEVRNVTSL